MRGTGKIILAILFFGAMLLLYVHGQISLFRISYLLDARSEQYSRMSEEYRSLKFEVDQLKAPRLLEEKIKDLSLDLALPSEIRVVRSTPVSVVLPVKDIPAPQNMSNGFADFLGRWIDVAQAKTDNG